MVRYGEGGAPGGRYGQEHGDCHNQEAAQRAAASAEKVAKTSVRLATRAARWAAVKAGKALVGKLLVTLLAGIKAAALALAKVLLVVGLILLVLLLIVGVFYLAFYAVFPSHGIFAGVEPDERDAIIREWAEEAVSEWNVRETWLVEGEGAWHPGTGWLLGRLVDRYGRDAKLVNRWGDAYMPALLMAVQAEDDLFQDDAWVQERFADAAQALRPWFYYKESTVTYCAPAGEDGEGGGCNTETVYLLVEAYTIRGHFRYTHEWHTETYADGGSVTYERPLDVEVVSDGREYLLAYLERVFELPKAADREWLVLAFEEGSIAYTEQQERLEWLIQEYDVPVYAFLSGSAIPPEYRDFLAEAERVYGVPAWFLAGLIQVESSWNPRAPNGLAGVVPEDDPHNPRKQILAAAERLAGVLGSVDWDGDNWRAQVEPALREYKDYGVHAGLGMAWAADVLSAAEAFRDRAGLWPVPGYYHISSGFGMRKHPLFGTWRMHAGIDIPAPTGTPVVAVAGGVAEVLNEGARGYGLYVVVRGVQADYYYAHLSKSLVRTGDLVLPGNVIGLVGSTGDSSGPHLHFGVYINGQPVDPLGVL